MNGWLRFWRCRLIHSFIICLIIIIIPSTINSCSSTVEQWIFTRCWFNPSHGSYEDGWDDGWDHQPVRHLFIEPSTIHLVLHLLYHHLIHLNLVFLCCFCIVLYGFCVCNSLGWFVFGVHTASGQISFFFTLTNLAQTFGSFVGSTNFTAGLLPKQERILQCANSIAIP